MLENTPTPMLALLRESLSVAAEKLLPYGFVRVHRSALINDTFVVEIEPWTTGEYVVRIKGGKEFHASRSYRRNLHSLASLWLGTHGFSGS
jgi:two-component system LytT family response regulator